MPASLFATSWHVGLLQMYTLPSQVKNLVQDGDTIYIDGGVYLNDAVKWTHRDLKFIGLGSGAQRTVLQYSGDIPNGKGIFVFETPGSCDNAYVENIIFDGAQVSDANGANGAGIRFQAKDLTVVNCKFVNCQNGILEGNGSVSTSNVTLRNCEFENNGYQLPNDPTYSGYEHHIYISASTDTLLVTNCYFHDPRGQANSLKTRAQKSYILYNYIDEANGYGSWEIDIAQGGMNVIMGNVIVQGASGANHGIIGYDAVTNPIEEFYFVNNTVINKFSGNVKYFNAAPTGINVFKVYNNIFASVIGASTNFMTGNIPVVLDTVSNQIFSDYMNVGFVDPAIGDYNLLSSATSVIDATVNAGSTNDGFLLSPDSFYVNFQNALSLRVIYGNALDAGAFEYSGSSTVSESAEREFSVYPNPASEYLMIETKGKFDYVLRDLFGRALRQGISNELVRISLSDISTGCYSLEVDGRFFNLVIN